MASAMRTAADCFWESLRSLYLLCYTDTEFGEYHCIMDGVFVDEMIVKKEEQINRSKFPL